MERRARGAKFARFSSPKTRSVSGQGSRQTTHISITYRHGLSETAASVEAIADIHRQDLPHIESIYASIEPDREEWRKSAEVEWNAGRTPEDLIAARVIIQVWEYGPRLEVHGPSRTSVVGLAQQLTTLLERAARGASWRGLSTGNIALGGFFVLLIFLVLLTPGVVHATNLAQQNDQYEPAEVIGLCLAVALALGASVAFWKLLPTVEVLGEGEPSRLQRFRGWIVLAVVTVVLGVVSAFLYDAL